MENKSLMIINTLNLLKEEYSKLRAKITEKLSKKLSSHLTRELLNANVYSFITDSFNLKNLLLLGQKAKITKNEILSNIPDIKTMNHAAWCNFPLEILIDEEFTEGIGYYIGDGRLKTNSGLSTSNTDIKTIKFFLNWLRQYFNAKNRNIRINIFLPRTNFVVNLEKRKWAQLLGLNINLVKRKHKYKDFHKTIIEVNYSRTIAKLVLDKLIPKIKEKCSGDKSFAMAYLRGIMTAEGSPRYNAKSHQKAVHLKMKNKTEVQYVFKLLKFLGLTPSFLFSKQDGEWLVSISGFSELKELDEINIFRSHLEKGKKLKKILSNYHHQQAKKGQVREFYLNKLFEFEEKYGKYCTARQLSEYIKRDKTRVINVLRKLQRDGLLRGERIMRVGIPFKFTLTQTGKEFILKKPLATYRFY